MNRTAVAAPPAEPFDDLFAFMDGMTLVELLTFMTRLTALECISCPVHGDRATVRDHGAACDETCFDTHAYWRAR